MEKMKNDLRFKHKMFSQIKREFSMQLNMSLVLFNDLKKCHLLWQHRFFHHKLQNPNSKIIIDIGIKRFVIFLPTIIYLRKALLTFI